MKDSHNQLKFRLIAISERMEVEFGVRLEDITSEHLNEELPWKNLKQSRDPARLKIMANQPMAIEAYEETIRCDMTNINTQRQDVIQAKDRLATITEIELTAKANLWRHLICLCLIEVFRSLFTDDDICGSDSP
jgi:hypothetical protein